jgi:ADP-heptose:LPS heptosyltransferase
MRTINVCSGIGDNIWLLMKLVNQPEKFNFKLPDGFPQRGKQIFDIFPQVAASAEYAKLKTKAVLAAPNDRVQWSQITADTFNLSCNHHLDTGKRIERFLPDLKTSFILDYDTGEYKEAAASFIPGSNYVGIYSSSYHTSTNWGAWHDKEWFELSEMLHKQNPDFIFVVIGADWDADLETSIIKRFDEANIPYIKLIGQPLGLVCEVLKRLDMFIGFPSGLSILNETLGAKRTLMFYPKHLRPMQNAWADPQRIESNVYKGCQFCPPEKAFEWIKTNWL